MTGSGGAIATTLTFDDLYQRQWWPMLRLATGLVDHVTVAEDVVQDAFAAVYRHWDSIRDPAAAVGYLRTAVVNHSRSALRRRIVARRHLIAADGATTSAATGAGEAADHTSLLAAEHQITREALSRLPLRQREVLTLRYLMDLPDADIAQATGLSLGGVRSAASRGLATLRDTLGGQL